MYCKEKSDKERERQPFRELNHDPQDQNGAYSVKNDICSMKDGRIESGEIVFNGIREKHQRDIMMDLRDCAETEHRTDRRPIEGTDQRVVGYIDRVIPIDELAGESRGKS